MKNQQLLHIKNLKVDFHTYYGISKVLDNISLSVDKGSLFGLAGETGCGKSVTAYSIIRMLPRLAKYSAGQIIYKGENLLTKSESEIHRKYRGKEIALVMQNPQNTLNPSVKIKQQLLEALLTHRKIDKKDAIEIIIDMLRKVKINNPEYRLDQYPHELSGGLQQRINTAINLVCNPSLLIADEFTTNLDVTTQAEVMKLIISLQEEFGTSIILITHDLALISQYCHRVGIVYAGQIVESGNSQKVFSNPLHPYTKGLMECIPDIKKEMKSLSVISGRVPQLINPPKGCRFHTRCNKKINNVCDKEVPSETEISEDHSVWCYLY